MKNIFNPIIISCLFVTEMKQLFISPTRDMPMIYCFLSQKLTLQSIWDKGSHSKSQAKYMSSFEPWALAILYATKG